MKSFLTAILMLATGSLSVGASAMSIDMNATMVIEFFDGRPPVQIPTDQIRSISFKPTQTGSTGPAVVPAPPLPTSQPQVTSMNVSGNWIVTFSGTDRMSMSLQQSGLTVTGTLSASDNSRPYVTGRMDGRTLTLSRETGLDTVQHYQVTVDGNRFSGSYWNVGKYPGKGSFTGERR